MNRELLQQAIATIGYYASVCGEDDQDTPAKQTIKALKEELEKPDPNPVAWGVPDACHNIVETISPYEKEGEMKLWANQYSVPLYTKEQP